MPDKVTELHVLETPCLSKITSRSSTVYYCDTRDERRGPLLMRAKGTGWTGRGFHDDQWVSLTRLECTPILQRDGKDLPEEEIDWDNVRPWVLRVGARHKFDYHVPGGFMDTTDYWWIQRPYLEIERLDDMPPEGERTIQEREPRPGGG